MWTTLRCAPSCPHIHTDYYGYDPVNTISHKGEMHFKNGTFGVLTMGSTLEYANRLFGRAALLLTRAALLLTRAASLFRAAPPAPNALI